MNASVNPAGWEIVQQKLHREFSFPNFSAAIQFVNQVAIAAETADHHPDITIHYKTVVLELTTHSAGEITEKDYALARTINELT